MTSPIALSNLQEYEGDLLKASVHTIAHQCNVMSRFASGLAAVIFETVPESDTYNGNPQPLQFGTWSLFDANPHNLSFQYVLNLYTQMYPGAPQWGADSAANRLRVFRETIDDYLTSQSGAVYSIAFPKYIGCALGGGNWFNYRKTICDVAELHPHVAFHIIEKVSTPPQK